jgi:DNA-binding MarR family transcriptional regulator
MKKEALPGKEIVREEDVCVCFNVRKAARVITHLYDEVMRPLGYRGTQITLLGVVSRFQPITIKRLAGMIDSEPTTLLRNLRLLEKNKLVFMRHDEKDHRAQVVTLSPKGEQLLRKSYPLWKKTQDRIAARVGKKRLNAILHDLQDALEIIQKDPGGES